MRCKTRMRRIDIRACNRDKSDKLPGDLAAGKIPALKPFQTTRRWW